MSATTVNDLANGLTAVGVELTSDPSLASIPAIAVDVVGESRALNPFVRKEAYRVGAEALRNAVRHAEARRITVTIQYEARQFRLSVHDDGQGIDEETMDRRQKPGHFGLRGMMEPATAVKGTFDVRSARGVGTEIELCVPGAIAYGDTARARWWAWPRLS